MKIVYCIIIYLIPFIVPFILKFASNIIPMEYDDSWKSCWDYVKKNKNGKYKFTERSERVIRYTPFLFFLKMI